MERRGDMIVRILEPRSIGGKHAVDAAHRLLSKGDARHSVQVYSNNMQVAYSTFQRSNHGIYFSWWKLLKGQAKP